jgi:peptide/nickel transport system substrate-binding protein
MSPIKLHRRGGEEMRIKSVVFVVIVCLSVFSSYALAQPKGTVTVAVSTDFMSLDPVGGGYTGTGQMMHRHMAEGLIEFGPDGKMYPRLATSWKLVDDKTWRFTLRKGVKFHNGNPFTAADVKFSIDYFMDPQNKWNYRALFAGHDGVQIIDDHTIDIKTKAPDPVMPTRWATRVRIFSKKFYDENGSEGLQRQVIGTGPFKFVSWQRNDRVTMEANTDWYLDPPKIKTAIFRIIPEMGARVAEWQAGGVDIIEGIPPFMVPQLKKVQNAEIQSVLGVRAMYMLLDTIKSPELKDRRVRQALNYAVDKEAIIKGVLNGTGTPLGTHVPLRVAGADTSIKPYPYDPEKAKALLKEAGYPNGFSIKLYSPNARYPMDKEVTLAVADQLSKVGIKTDVQIMESNLYLKELAGHNFGGGIYLIGMASAEWDVDYALNQLPSNFVLCYYPDKAVDEMVSKTRTLMDPNKRFESASRIQKFVHEEALYLFLYNEVRNYGISKRVKGFEAPGDELMTLWRLSVTD